jgi:hypothetical protein
MKSSYENEVHYMRVTVLFLSVNSVYTQVRINNISDQINDDGMGGTYSMHGQLGSKKERDDFGYLGATGTLMLKFILEVFVNLVSLSVHAEHSPPI